MAWDVNNYGKKMLRNRDKPIRAFKSILRIAKALVLNELCAVVRRRTMVRAIVF